MFALRIGLLLALGLTLTLAEDEVIKCPGGECVKLHLCREGEIVTDGSNLIDIRFNPDDPCEHYLLKCCAVPGGDEDIAEPPFTGAELIEPPSSGPHSENLIGSSTESSQSTGSSGSTGSLGSTASAGSTGWEGSAGSTGSVGSSGTSEGHSSGHGREENAGNYYGGGYQYTGGSISSTYSESSSSSSSSFNQNSQQWTVQQGSLGGGVAGGGATNLGGSSGYGTGHSGVKGQGTGQAGSAGHGTAQAGYGSGQSGNNAQGTGQLGQGTGGMGPLGHGGVQPGSSGQGAGQMGHGIAQTGFAGFGTEQSGHDSAQSGSMVNAISQSGTSGGGSQGFQHGVSSGSMHGSTGGGVSSGHAGSSPGGSSDGGYDYTSTHNLGDSNLVTGNLHGSIAGASGTHTGGQTLQESGGQTLQGTGGQILQGSGGQFSQGSVGVGTGQMGHGTGQSGSMRNVIDQTGTATGGSLGSQHGSTGESSTGGGSAGGTMSSGHAGSTSGGSSAGGFENTSTHNLEGSNLVAGDLYGGTAGASGTHTGGSSVTGNQEGQSTHQTGNVGSNNLSGNQSGAHQVVGSGQSGTGNVMHGSGNVVSGVGTVTKDQTKDTSNVNAGGSTSTTSGTWQQGQASSNHYASQNIHSTSNVGSNQGYGQAQSGSSTVKHYEGDGCSSHTQKHSPHHGHGKGTHGGSGYNNNLYHEGTTVNPILPPQENLGCGFRNPDGVGFRITGNSDGEAEYGEFPWMVAILKEEKALDQVINVYQCGGSLIHPRVVLTAAHCVQNKKPHEVKVRLGEWDTQTTNEIHDHQDRNVAEIVVHDKFYKGGLFNDVALLFLDKPAEIIDTVNTVCLPPQDFNFDLSRCFASGWGKDVFGKEGKYQVILKKIELPIMPFNQCQDALRTTRLGKRFILNKSFICAGGEPKKDTCKGDGGSPLVCPIIGAPNRFYQAGIVAWGIGCGEHGIPGVYVNVAGFRNWIDEHLTQRSIPHNYYIAV